ncbi:MAG: hypothetical protein ACRCX2_00480, partial [Paraclostridium sp.]
MSILYCKSISVYKNEIPILKIESVSSYLITAEKTQEYKYNNYVIKFNICSKNTNLYLDLSSKEAPIRLIQNNEYWFSIFNIQSEKFDLFKDMFFGNKGIIDNSIFK